MTPTSKDVEKAVHDECVNPGQPGGLARIREAQHRATLASLSASPEPQGVKCLRCGHSDRQHTLLTGVASQPSPACSACHGCLYMVWPDHPTEKIWRSGNPPASLPDVEAGIEKAVEAVLAHYGWKVPDYTESNVEASRQEWRYKLRLVLPYLVAPLEAKVRELEGEVEVTRKAEAQANIRFGAERNRVHEMERVVAAGVTQTDTARARARALQDDIAKLDKMLDEERLEAYKILTRAEDAESRVEDLSARLAAAEEALKKYGAALAAHDGCGPSEPCPYCAALTRQESV